MKKSGSASSASSRGGSGGPRSKPSSASSDSGRPSRPSDKLNPKTCDPFSNKQGNSAFASVYSNGGLPCRLVHGSVKHKLAWSTPVESVSYEPVLVTLAEGLKETVHPYAFVARQGFVELLQVPGADRKALTVLSKLINPIRTALGQSDNQAFEAGLEAATALSNAVGESLNQHLKQFMVALSKRLTDHSYRDKVIATLQIIERNGGREATTVIKSKIPTYNSVVVNL